MKYDRINHFLPTYQRVKSGKLPRYIESVIVNMKNSNYNCISFLVNKSDSETLDYLEGLKISVESEILFWTQEREPNLSAMYNFIFDHTSFNDPTTLVSMVGDDMRWETKNFDQEILNVINRYGGKRLVFCNDGFKQGEKLCVNLFTSRQYVENTKHPFMCEKFKSYFIDTVWNKFSYQTKTRSYLKNVILRHYHCSDPGVGNDITAQRLRAVQMDFSKGYKEVDLYVQKMIALTDWIVK